MALIRTFILLLTLSLAGPVLAQDELDHVKVGVLVTSISNIDTSQGRFDISAYAWFSDPLGMFDPEKHLQIYARDYRIKVVQRLPIKAGGVFTAVQITASVDQLYETRDYPFDHQTLRLGFETQFNTEQLVLEGDSDDLAVADFAAIHGWDVNGLRFEQYVAPYDIRFGLSEPHTFSNLNVVIDVARQRSAFVIENFIGFAVAILIASLIYFVPTDQIGARVSMVTSSIFATVGNRYALDAALGAGASLGLVDKLSFIVFGTIYIALATSLASYRLRTSRSPQFAETFDKWVGGVATTTSLSLAALALYNAIA